MTQLLDFFVDGGVLLDERVRRRHVSLGLVVVVVRHEVHDCVVGEELLQLGCQLGCKRLVGRHDQRGLLHRLDGLGHGERLARARDAEQCLVTQPILHAFSELFDCLRLVARHLVGRDHAQRRVRKPHLGQLAFHGRAVYVRKMCHRTAELASKPRCIRSTSSRLCCTALPSCRRC